ncbi:MAG: hypothetical protein ACRBBR_00715 [Cellvibrionaceae bacterium]
MGKVKFNEAVRIKVLPPEIVRWRIIKKSDSLDKLGLSHAAGEFEVGNVVVTNEFGAAWCLPVERFDVLYRSRG